jgi:hypothetical protein
MEPVICSVHFDSFAGVEVSFEVCALAKLDAKIDTCLIVSTNKFAPVHGYSIVDYTKSVCLFTRDNKVYHNHIPKDEYVPLLVPLSEYKMFQLEFMIADEFKFGVEDSIYSCVVTEVNVTKVFIEHESCDSKDIFSQFEGLHKKIPHRVPQRPRVQRCKSLPCVCGIAGALQNTLAKTTSSTDLLNQRNQIIPPVQTTQNEYDADRIFKRSFDYITKLTVWRIREVNVNKLLVKFNPDVTMYRLVDQNTSIRVNLTRRDGVFVPLVYSPIEAFKFGVLLDVTDIASATFSHNGYDIALGTVTLI